MSELHFNSLNTERQVAFRKLVVFSDIGVLGGGTALLMQFHHRKSFDFDIFLNSPIEKKLLERVSEYFGEKFEILVDTGDELSLSIPSKVKITFIYFPYDPLYPVIKTESLSIFDWKDITADKAYTIGRRGEYRDYVDIFFALKKGLSLEKIIKDTYKKFNKVFSEKLFLGQLVYFDDLVDFTCDFIDQEYSPEQIKHFLEKSVFSYTKRTCRS